ncbi:phosphatase PAP2 family protein [Hymenobacter latericus]|uniref:phosphatase PAP2 family protein n=1 Tax=Hymenobacter sp. YIM 151858-1 TaxID=2987688 RepID=UPI002225CA4D|nr:phosphatase PAP2 family protein [Hymenobacter sp. YIM 151858-1]UYZ59058.1 phosphatase PAP2 family protein [Hymenobacter sp. YIM 151858-1]
MLLLSFALLVATPDSARLPDSAHVRPAETVMAPAAAAPARSRFISKLVVPAALLGYGALTVNKHANASAPNYHLRDELNEQFPRFRTRLDDYSRHAPLVAAYALPLAGLKGRYNAVDFTLLYAGAYLLNTTLTSQAKRLVGECRPGNAADHSSFPSAHTSQAFLTATLLHEQYRGQSPWIGIGGYAVATATGAMRMLNDKHWLSDVAAGAGLGVLSAEVAWRVYPWLRQRISAPFARRLMLMPVAGPRMGGVAIALRP